MRAIVFQGLLVIVTVLTSCTALVKTPVDREADSSAAIIDLDHAPDAAAAREAPEAVSENRATRTLLAQADQLEAKGELEASAAALERALRIEPRNGRLWHRLAAIRLLQGKFSLAANLAAKSNSLAGKDSELIARNNQLIREARSP